MTEANMPNLNTRNFASDTRGTITMEAVILFPLMFWLLIFGPITFDIVRERTAVVRNTYMVAKAASLAKVPITDSFIEFYHSAFDALFDDAVQTGVRITEFSKDPDSGDIEVLWEDETAEGFTTTVASKIATYQDALPHFVTNECVLMVEGWRNYSSILQWNVGEFTLGWKNKRLYHRVFVRPRWETCITRVED